MFRTFLPAIAALATIGIAACASTPPENAPPTVATFSIVGFDSETGDLGVAVQSKFFGVGAVVPFARAGVGAIATQAWANTTYGPTGLALLERGLTPEKVVSVLTGRDAGRDFRQLGIVDATGSAASYTGGKANAWAGHLTGENFACQGNILAGETVVKAMAKTFRETEAPLPERLVAALAAGQAAGGDSRGRQSAALLVVRRQGGYSGFNDRYVDVRVDDHPLPIEELGRLLALHRKTFGVPPLPGGLKGFRAETSRPTGPLSTPLAAWNTFVARFRARDFEGLYAAHGLAYRKAHPFEEFRDEIEANAGGIESFIERAVYVGTRIDDERAQVALSLTGAPRHQILLLVREEGEWRLAE